MRVIYSVTIIAMYAFLSSCNQHSRFENNAVKIMQDSSKWVTIPFTNQRSLQLDSTYTKTDLSGKEVVETFKILLAALQKSNSGLSVENYKIQLVPFKNPAGEKQVFVNCFCEYRYEDWKTRLVLVLDGGDCFFNVSINLSKQSAGEVFVNGLA